MLRNCRPKVVRRQQQGSLRDEQVKAIEKQKSFLARTFDRKWNGHEAASLPLSRKLSGKSASHHAFQQLRAQKRGHWNEGSHELRVVASANCIDKGAVYAHTWLFGRSIELKLREKGCRDTPTSVRPELKPNYHRHNGSLDIAFGHQV